MAETEDQLTLLFNIKLASDWTRGVREARPMWRAIELIPLCTFREFIQASGAEGQRAIARWSEDVDIFCKHLSDAQKPSLLQLRERGVLASQHRQCPGRLADEGRWQEKPVPSVAMFQEKLQSNSSSRNLPSQM